MPDDATPPPNDRVGDHAGLGAIAGRMDNALSCVVTNLHLLSEELEALDLDGATRARITRILADADDGAHRASGLARELAVSGWNRGPDHAGPPPLAQRLAVDAVGGADLSQDALVDDDTWSGSGAVRVLVVDDEPQVLSAVGRALRRYLVSQAASGREAEEILQQRTTFDVVLCDVTMRDADGMELHRWIKRHRPDLLDRVVFMTAGVFTRQVRQFLSSVPNTVLHKPFDTKTLRWVVAQKLRSQQREADAEAGGDPPR